MCNPSRIARLACATESGACEAMRPAASSASSSSFAWFAQLVDHTPGECFLGGKGACCEYQLFCAPLADRPGQRLSAAATRHDAERHLGKRKLRRFRCVSEVAHQYELEAARVSRAVDRGNHGNRAVEHRPEHALEDYVLRDPLLIVERSAFLEIGTRAECPLACAGEDHAAMPLSGRDLAENAVQIECGLGVEGIGDLGAVESREEDAIRPFFQPQRFEILSIFDPLRGSRPPPSTGTA